MKIARTIVIAFMATASFAETVNFDNATVGSAPTGWTCTKTGSGTPQWPVEKDEKAQTKPNVLKQSGQATYPVCITDDPNLKDGFVAVNFKPVSGKEDQAG